MMMMRRTIENHLLLSKVQTASRNHKDPLSSHGKTTQFCPHGKAYFRITSPVFIPSPLNAPPIKMYRELICLLVYCPFQVKNRSNANTRAAIDDSPTPLTARSIRTFTRPISPTIAASMAAIRATRIRRPSGNT